MKLKAWMAACGLAVCLLAQQAVAGPGEDANAAYERGDYATALQLMRPLAEQGDASAQNNLGVMYSNGQGVPLDYFEALKWYRLAAEQGLSISQFSVGQFYLKGQGVRLDYAVALKWLRLSAEQGYAGAQNNLGVMYARGLGVPQDYSQAYMWYNLAAAGYSATESEDRDVAANNRDQIAKQMTPEQIAEAQRLAREWWAAHPGQ